VYVVDRGIRRVEEIGGAQAIRVGELWAAPSGSVWMDSSPGLFEILPDGTFVPRTEVPGLDYPLTGGERSFSDGAVIDLTFAPDGAVWALTREQIPEWDEDAAGA
jgi:hypothetical protein